MQDEDWELLRERATALIAEVQRATGAARAPKVVWFRIGADSSSIAPAFRIDQDAKAVGLNRRVVEDWFDALPQTQARDRFAALALRAAAALLFAPPARAWSEAAAAHIRSEQDSGLDESYAKAFQAAHAILEGHRQDQRVLDLFPGEGDRLAELVRFDLESHPAFDIYPRAAIVMGRPHLPKTLAQSAFDEFVDEYGLDEAEELMSILNEYVALPPEAVEEMVDATAELVFHAFPEAMGLAWGEPTSDDWPLRRRLREGDAVGWKDLVSFIAATLSRFTGEAGLDFGDALLIGVNSDPLAGSRVGAWSRSGNISLDLTQAAFDANAHRELLARGWEEFGNAPSSYHKDAAVRDAEEVAVEIVWIIGALFALPSPVGLVLWGRGPAAQVAQDRGWKLAGTGSAEASEPLIAHPSDHMHLARLVRSSLRDFLGGVEPEEYEPGRFAFHAEGLEFVVLATERAFPAIRFHHRVLDPPDTMRDDLVEFANALHGRSSTCGSHWWLGNTSLWQVCEFWASKFDQEIFNEQLRVFITVACDRTPEIRARFEVRDEETGGDEGDWPDGLVAALANAGLACPPLGSFELGDVTTFGRWHWGTHELSPLEMYLFEVEPVVAALVKEGRIFAMSHAGHGLNSYGLTVVTTGGPFAVFVQHLFGGVYTDPLWARLQINEAYTYLHVLLAADELEDANNPKWLLLYSQFRGPCGIVDLEEVRGGKPWEEAFTPSRDFGSLIRAAVALVPGEEFIVSGTSIDWGEDEPGEEGGPPSD